MRTGWLNPMGTLASCLVLWLRSYGRNTRKKPLYAPHALVNPTVQIPLPCAETVRTTIVINSAEFQVLWSSFKGSKSKKTHPEFNKSSCIHCTCMQSDFWLIPML